MGGPAPIPVPLSSAPGATPQEGAGRLINCYAEPTGDGGTVWRRSPGLSAFGTSGVAGFRGASLVKNLVYFANNGVMQSVDGNGNVTLLGTFPGTKKVSIARNQAATPDVQAVDPDNGAYVITPTSVTAFTGLGNLPQPNSVCAQDQYFFWTIGDNRLFAAGPNSTAVNALTFTTVQSRATGSLLRGVSHAGLLFAFCTTYAEMYSDTANASPGFPYTRLKVMDRGLIGYAAIAGWEDGFSRLMWVADDFSVCRFNVAALDYEKISPPDLDRLIEAVPDKSTIEASCYVHAGHSFWVVSSPTWSWEFNLNTSKWNERWSYLPGQNTASIWTRWRATGPTASAFGKWLTGDIQTGNIIAIDDTVYAELGQPQLYRIESGEVSNFPNNTRVARADFKFVMGRGIANSPLQNVQNPTARISWSDDGQNYSTPLVRPLGQQGNGTLTVDVKNVGRTAMRGRRWRIDITDPIYVGYFGGTQSDDPRPPR